MPRTTGALLKKKCLPCEGGRPVLTRSQARVLLKGLSGWRLTPDGKTLVSDYLMKDFSQAIAFIDKIAALAEREDHHPDIHLTHYRRLSIHLSTHAIGGLSENDFILAAKIDRIPRRLKN